MVVFKGKSSTSTNRVSEGVIKFKIYAENVKFKNGSSETVDAVSKRKSVPANSRIAQGGFNKFDKTNSKCDGSVRTSVGRKVLADIGNAKAKISRNELHNDTLKARASVGSDSTAAAYSSSKPFTGKVRANMNNVVGCNTSKRVVTKDLRTSSNYPRNQVQHKFVNPIGRKSDKNSLPPTRKSLPVLKSANQMCTSELKHLENTENLEKSKAKYGFPVKSKIGKKMMPQVSNVRNPIWRNRVSDGFIIRDSKVQPKMDIQALSRKPLKPVLKKMVRVSSIEKMSKFKCTSLREKSTSSDDVSSSKEKAVETSFLLEHTSSAVLHKQAAEIEVSSDRKNDTESTASDIDARRKSTRRKSYTSLLMARPKFLEEYAETRKEEIFPKIYDACNHLEVAEYVDDIYKYYWFMEAQHQRLKNYVEIQTDVTPKMRGILINWLIEVHLKFDLMPETLYLMVTLLDHYLSLVSIKKNEMQLVGLTALLLASKYEDFWHPRVSDLISISAESYTRGQMLGMEKAILTKLKFRLNMPTPYVFMLRLLKAVQSDTKFEHLSFYLIELCLVEYEALRFKPSLLCASAIYLARCTLYMTPAWTPLLAKHAHYEESQIRDSAELILKFHKAAKTAILNVTYEKYMKPEYSHVATIKHLVRLPL